MHYRALYQTRTGIAAIHSLDCARAKRNSIGEVSFECEAANAEEAARKVYEQEEFEARGMKMPRVCKCAK